MTAHNLSGLRETKMKTLAALMKEGGQSLPRKEASCCYCGKAFETYASLPTTFSELPKANTPGEVGVIQHCGSAECWRKEHMRQDAQFNALLAVERARKERDANKGKTGKTKSGADASGGNGGRPEAASLFPDQQEDSLRDPGKPPAGPTVGSPADIPDDPF